MYLYFYVSLICFIQKVNMASVYVGTSLLNVEQARQIISKFRSYGVNISYDWTTSGQVFTISDLQECGVKEVNGVKNADLFFMIHPARFGTHVELGIAIACDKPVIMVTNHNVLEQKTFYHLHNVFSFVSIDEGFAFALRKLLN